LLIEPEGSCSFSGSSLAKLRFLKVAVPKLKFWNSLDYKKQPARPGGRLVLRNG
jgi:hypothetical protein